MGEISTFGEKEIDCAHVGGGGEKGHVYDHVMTVAVHLWQHESTAFLVINNNSSSSAIEWYPPLMQEPLMGRYTGPLNMASSHHRRSHTATAAVLLTKVSSAICSFLFIGFIFNFSVCNYIYNRYIIRDHTRRVKDVEMTRQLNAYPDEEEMKVTTDLSYYAGLIGLKLVEYEITTEDGFIITLQRLYDPKIDEKKRDDTLKPILLLHGLMQSSGSFVTSGYKSLAYFLVNSNYDIWLGNNRCGFKPQHVKYHANDHQMWDWDLDEMAYYDIPAMIKQIKAIKPNYNGKLSIISHSQGTTQTIYLLSNRDKPDQAHEHVEMIDKCILLAPAIYGGPLLNSKMFIKFMRFLPDGIYEMFFGINSFMPILMYMRKFSYKSPMFGLSSYMVFSYLFDWNDYLWDAKLRRYHFIFSPVFVSVKLMKWWLRGQGFAMNKPIISNPDHWFDENTPEIFLVIGGKDDLVNGDLFIDRLLHKETNMNGRWNYIKVPEYSHLDVLWADDLLETVGDSLLEFLK